MSAEFRTQNHGRFTMIAASLFVGAIALTACGSDGVSGKLSYEDSPLMAYTNAGYDPNQSEEDMRAEAEAQEQKVQEAIAACMTKQGFEYTPYSNAQFFFGNDLDVEWDSKEFAEKYGYGVFTDPWGNYDPERQQEAEEQYKNDPNTKYRESLSQSQQEAYDIALNGDPMANEPTIGEDGEMMYEYNWETAGCYGEAQHNVYGEDAWNNDEFQPLMDRMQTIYEQTQADPRVQELDTKWSSCMADAGFAGLATPMAANEQYYTKLNELQNAFYSSMPEPTEEQLNDPNYQWPQFDMNSPEVKAEAENEIKQATADWDCKDKLNHTSEQLKIQFEHEQKFIDENKAELEAFKAAQEQRQQ